MLRYMETGEMPMHQESHQHRPLALITGASAGIGTEFAHVFANEGHDLVLVARSQDKLQALADELSSQHDCACTVVPADLGDPAAPQALFDELELRGLAVDVLVNNAGLLHRGAFNDTPLEAHLQLLQVNINACTALAYLFLPPMLQRGRGRILNVCSTSSFGPLPYLSTYAASKAYLLSLSEALALETRGTGVTVTALCPGFTNTPMIAKEGDQKAMNVPFIKNMEADVVARQGYEACMAGKPMYINGAANRLLIELSRYEPRAVRRWMSLQAAKKGF